MPEKNINKNVSVKVTQATITDNIKSIYLRIIADKEGIGKDLAESLQGLALIAIEKGLGTTEWGNYMKFFASNQEQLNRLIGKDTEFNKAWKKTLSYIVANSTCGVNTDTLTGKNLNTEALRALDATTVSADVEAGFEKEGSDPAEDATGSADIEAAFEKEGSDPTDVLDTNSKYI